jgi:hypothetical protein
VPFLRSRRARRGDITLAPRRPSNAFVLWSHPRASGYTPSALVHQGRVYLVHDTGIMVVVAADTGKEIYKAARRRRRPHVSAVANRHEPTGSIFRMRTVTIVIAPGRRVPRDRAERSCEMTLASPRWRQRPASSAPRKNCIGFSDARRLALLKHKRPARSKEDPCLSQPTHRPAPAVYCSSVFARSRATSCVIVFT